MSSGRAALAGLVGERPADRLGLAQLLGPRDLRQVDEDIVRGDPSTIPGEPEDRHQGRPVELALHPSVGAGVDQARLPEQRQQLGVGGPGAADGAEPGRQPRVVDRDEPGLGALDLLDEHNVGLAQPHLRPGCGRVLHLDRDHRVAADLAAGQRVTGSRFRLGRGRRRRGRRCVTRRPRRRCRRGGGRRDVAAAGAESTGQGQRGHHGRHSARTAQHTCIHHCSEPRGWEEIRRPASDGAGPPVTHLELLPRAARTRCVAADPGVRVVGLGARLADRLDRPVLVRRRVRQ